MKNLSQIKLLIIVASLIGLGYGGKYLLKQNQTPEKVAASFLSSLENAKDYEKLKNYVLPEDYSVISSEKEGYQKLLPFKQNGSSKIILTKITPLSESAQKVDFMVGETGYTINMNKISGEWLFSLELKKSKKISLLKQDIGDLNVEMETNVDKDKEIKILKQLVDLYMNLKALEGDESLEAKIFALKSQLQTKQEQLNYLDLVSIKVLKISGNLITVNLENSGNLYISKIKAKMDIFNKNDELTGSQESVIYEVIPGNFVYGQKIKPKYTKKIILALPQSLPKDSKVNFSATELEF